MEKQQGQKPHPITYYGKKAYRDPSFARQKPIQNKTPEYRYEDIEEKQPSALSQQMQGD